MSGEPAAWVLIAALLANTIAHLPATRYADNRFDAATREAVGRIAADRPAAAGSVSIGGSWQLEPGLNFYRVVQRLDWMTRVERRTPARGDDYYVFLRRMRGWSTRSACECFSGIPTRRGAACDTVRVPRTGS